jgi:hypothetical protein
MKATGVDVLVTAPQKGWSGSPCCAMVMLSERARAAIDATTSTSFACDLKKWLQIMETYEAGGHAYHATLPTDALTRMRDVMQETQARGFETARAQQQTLGDAVRALPCHRRRAAKPSREHRGQITACALSDLARLPAGYRWMAAPTSWSMRSMRSAADAVDAVQRQRRDVSC